MYDAASKFIKQNDLGDEWMMRTKKIRDDSGNMRFDFHYALMGIFNNHFEKSNEVS